MFSPYSASAALELTSATNALVSVNNLFIDPPKIILLAVSIKKCAK
jgi:hypothetical protein